VPSRIRSDSARDHNLCQDGGENNESCDVISGSLTSFESAVQIYLEARLSAALRAPSSIGRDRHRWGIPKLIKALAVIQKMR